MKYPKQNRYLKIKRVGTDQVEITNMLTGEVWKTDWEYARLLRALDGKTHPYHIYESMDRESVKGLIRDFKECGFLDNKKRVYPQGLGSVLFILWSPRIKKIDRLLAALWNRLLLWTWLPVFFYGVHILFEKEYPYVTGNQQPGGFLLLMLLGLVFHEFSHTCACLSYGGDFYCTGLTLQNFLPGAFVMIDYDDVKGRFRRVQINAAGIETNVLLTGILLCLLKTGRFETYTLWMGALLNFSLALFNATLIGGLDGMGIYTELLGCSHFLESARRVVFSRRKRYCLKMRGMNGKALIAACYIIIFLQLLLPLVLTLNVISLAGMLF